MNQPVAQPERLQPTACPLLAAVLPVRYAIGPIDPRNPSSLDATSLGLPAIEGLFPDLGPDHPQLQERPLGYVPRMLRDGWLYVWDDSLQELNEYRVESSMLTPTARGGQARDKTVRPYLMLAAGAPVSLTWSPVEWSTETYTEVGQQAELRERLMRKITPGASPFSGAVKPTHAQIGDVKPENYRWSCAREAKYWLLEEPPLNPMRRCEQQHFALVDDPWGVLLDIACLLRARNQEFDKLNKHRFDEWSMAATVKSISEGDKDIRERLSSIVDVARVQRVLQEQEREQESLDLDRRRLAELWAAWFLTLGGSTPADLESACNHFDLSQLAQRDMLEASFAAACLGPAATPPGVKAIEEAISLQSPRGDLWLLLAVLGVNRKIEPGNLKQLLHIQEGAEVAADAGAATANLSRATALTLALNLGAERLQGLSLAAGGEALYATLSPILMGNLRASLAQQINQLAYNLMTAMLARSQQQLELVELSPANARRWLTAQMDQAHNKGQVRSLKKRIEELEREEARTARKAGTSAPAKSPTAAQVEDAIPHLRVVPAAQPSPPHAQPGYGSDVPHPAPSKPAALPPLSGKEANVQLPRNIRELLDEAPLKTLITAVAIWNLAEVGKNTWKDLSIKNVVSTTSAVLATATAATAVLQQLADTRWELHLAQASHADTAARKLLTDALGLAEFAMRFQAITAGIDVFYYGWYALDAYRAGDLDTAAVSTTLAGAQLGYARISLQAMRALRVARSAALAGEAEALATGIRVLSLPLRLSLVGLTITIFIGLISLIYTEDTPLEQWLKQTRFGIRPADWSGDFNQSMREFYRIVLPVSLKLERWNDIDPRSGVVNELRLVLRLPGQREYRQGMVSFDGYEEWQRSLGLRGLSTRCVPLVWGEEDPIPLDLDVGTRVQQEADGSVRLRRAYHEDVEKLIAIRGSLTYQPIEGLYLAAIDIDLS